MPTYSERKLNWTVSANHIPIVQNEEPSNATMKVTVFHVT